MRAMNIPRRVLAWPRGVAFNVESAVCLSAATPGTVGGSFDWPGSRPDWCPQVAGPWDGAEAGRGWDS